MSVVQNIPGAGYVSDGPRTRDTSMILDIFHLRTQESAISIENNLQSA